MLFVLLEKKVISYRLYTELSMSEKKKQLDLKRKTEYGFNLILNLQTKYIYDVTCGFKTPCTNFKGLQLIKTLLTLITQELDSEKEFMSCLPGGGDKKTCSVEQM